MAHAMYPGLPHTMEMEYWTNIDKYHLSYLHAEESPQKIAEKERLENVIKGYLGRIPHDRKFLIPTTAQIFQRSVTEAQNFSIVKLSQAWTVIGQYAQNLISQPWRKEFHKIQMYSGYYEHNVRNILIGGEQMLIYMGYVPTGDGVMCLEGPVDPDKVALVSKDCFIASTECQVMFQIYSEMIGRSNNVTYEDIFRFREENICDTNKAIFELSSPHQRPLSMYSTMGHPYGSACFKNLSQRSSYIKGSMNPHYQWHDGHYLPNEGHNYGTMIPPNSHLPPHYFYPTNGCSYPPAPRAYYSSGPPLHHAVPTGQLIELDSSHSKNHVNEKAHRRNGSEPLKHDYRYPNEDEVDFRHSKELVQNWLNYDELKNERKELARKVCEEMVKVNLSDFPSDTKSSKKKDKKPTKESLTRPVSLRPTSAYEQVEQPPSQKSTKSKTNSTPNLDMWECLACTYHNKVNIDVCEMCDKSRIQGNEVLPLASGGRECHKCTLVNERGEDKCRACGECLKDSPTYI